jgi:hypothetical protein
MHLESASVPETEARWRAAPRSFRATLRAMACSMTKTMSTLALVLAWACVPETGEDDDTSPGTTSVGSTDADGPVSTSEDPTVATTIDPTGSSSDATTEPTGSTLDATTSTPACDLPAVEQEVLDQLFIDSGLSSFVAAGSGAQLRLVWIDFGFPTEVEACVEWSIEPVDGVAIDETGGLTVDASVPAGTIISVTADVEEGRRILTRDFEVYVPVDYDILGLWTEVQQLPCDGGAAFVPDPIIGEVVFRDTSEFAVTWTPFEVYYDYWGTFTYDEGTGALVLTVDGGNYIPPDVDGEGTAMVVDGQLTLEDMWLGVAQDPVTQVACGHVLE